MMNRIPPFYWKVKKIIVDNLSSAFKFVIVGLINNVIYYVAYFILNKLGVYYMVANTMAFFISVINAYIGNSSFVFSKGNEKIKKRNWKRIAKTFVVYGFMGIIFNNFLLYFLVRIAEIHEMIAPFIILFFSVPVNYLANKLWVYRS